VIRSWNLPVDCQSAHLADRAGAARPGKGSLDDFDLFSADDDRAGGESAFWHVEIDGRETLHWEDVMRDLVTELFAHGDGSSSCACDAAEQLRSLVQCERSRPIDFNVPGS